MKKKLFVTATVIAVLAIIVSSSLAYFSDSDEVKNVFTIGSIEIVQKEDFVQESMLIPVVNVGLDPTADVAEDANFVKKEVTVENTGINSAYVQTFVAVPAELYNAGLLHIHSTSADWSAPSVVATVKESDITDSGSSTLDYVVLKYVYGKVLDKGNTTSKVIDGVYIDYTADIDVTRDAEGNATEMYFVKVDGTVLKQFNGVNQLNVYVASQAVQSRGFENSGAESALSSAFNAHPWAD